MTTPSDTATPPPSVAGSAEDQDQPGKKPRNRKLGKKPIPHASTLRGLWGHSKPSDDAVTATGEEAKTDDGTESDAGKVSLGEPLVFRIAPSKLAAAISLAVPRPLTPPNSLPDVIPETPVLANVEPNVTPRSRSGGKKRGPPNSAEEGLRRSPRNHAKSTEVATNIAKKPHPFFMGKLARMYLPRTI